MKPMRWLRRFKDAEEKLSEHGPTLAAVVMEPLMQGAAGMWAQPVAYLQAMRELCRRHGILFILDEVATGFGRTGKMFACDHAGVTPDILCRRQGHHRRLFAAGGDLDHRGNLLGVSRRVQRFQNFFSRPHLYRQSARLRGRHRQSRAVRRRSDRRENAAADYRCCSSACAMSFCRSPMSAISASGAT